MTHQTLSFADLTPAQREQVNLTFQSLARAQLGLPERLGTSPKANPGMFHATGAFCYLAEHLGDLTHRLSDGCDHTKFGFDMVNEKVMRGLRYCHNGYGLEREVDGNLRNNYAIYRENPNHSMSFTAYKAGFKDGAARYATAHSTLVVYNKAQWLGRECAVSLGQLDYDKLEQRLAALEAQLLAGPDAWVTWASQVQISPAGDVLPYQPSEPIPDLATPGVT
jgi:hypothetical protein